MMGNTHRTNDDRSTDSTNQRLGADEQQASGAISLEAEKVIKVKESEDLSSKCGLSTEVIVEEHEMSSSHPPEVRVKITNVSRGNMDVSTGSNLPVPPLGSQNENGGIILLPDDHGRERDSDCWRPKETTTVDGTDQEVKLGAGEAIEQVYEVWSHPNEDTCFAIGDYEFSVDYTTSNGSEQSLVWEFTLSVESVS